MPPGSTATVHVPTAADDAVLEGDAPAATSRGVKPLRRENDRAVFEVESGRYRFTSRL